MKKRELKELHAMMDDYGYMEPDLYFPQGNEILFIDSTCLNGNMIAFEPDDKTFTVVVYDEACEGEYDYEENEWEEGTSQFQIDAYQAVRLARDIGKKHGKN